MPAQIVIASDEVSIARWSTALRGAGYEVVGFANSMQALDALEAAERAELLITSVNFPIGTPQGISLSLLARKRRPKIKVILVGDPNLHEDLHELTAGIGDLLEPPVEASKLVAQVRRLVAPAYPLRGKRILIVEDETFTRLDLALTFAAAGADVVGACDTLSEASRVASSGFISAAILDLQLGRHTSERLARMLDDRKIPYFFYTGYPLAASALVYGRKPIIRKPAPETQLIETMVALLAA